MPLSCLDEVFAMKDKDLDRGPGMSVCMGYTHKYLP